MGTTAAAVVSCRVHGHDLPEDLCLTWYCCLRLRLHQCHRLRQCHCWLCQAWWMRHRLSDLRLNDLASVEPKGIHHRYHHIFHSPTDFLQRI